MGVSASLAYEDMTGFSLDSGPAANLPTPDPADGVAVRTRFGGADEWAFEVGGPAGRWE